MSISGESDGREEKSGNVQSRKEDAGGAKEWSEWLLWRQRCLKETLAKDSGKRSYKHAAQSLLVQAPASIPLARRTFRGRFWRSSSRGVGRK
jgi:hypothetical protein